MSIESGPQFLKEEYDLHNKPEVEAAVQRSEQQTGERVSHKPAERIQVFLDRLEHIFEPPALEGHEHFDRAERNLEFMKRALHERYVIKPEDVPERAFTIEQQAARELGHGNIELTDEFREKKTQEIINDQQSSMDNWLNYLTSPDTVYTTWAKYWAFRSMLSMGKLVKQEDEEGHETARFQKRATDTISPFPVLNPGALALTIGAVESSREQRTLPKSERTPAANMSDRLTDQEWQQLVNSENFAKLYAQFLIEQVEYSSEGLQNIRGKWVVYSQGSDPMTSIPDGAHSPLVPSIENYPLEWCTRNPETASGQLKGGDFYVFYSENEQGEAIIPRVAIRMEGAGEGARIGEVRGIAPSQNTDPYIAPVIAEKMAEFPDGAQYEKKAADMKHLTQIERLINAGRTLTKEDLIFLYEIDSPIEGFGISGAKDPRIDELRDQRDPLADALIFFECTSEQIAHRTSEISADSRAYIGPLEPGIFDLIQQHHIEHIFTSFPEGKIERSALTIGGQTAKQLEAELRAQDFMIDDYAQDMLHSPDFTTLPESEQVELVRLRVDALLDGYPTTDQVYARAQELGLELCPAEVGPYQRIQDADQPLGDWYLIAMKQIAARRGNLFVFYLSPNEDGPWLSNYSAGPADWWGPAYRFMFRLRKPSLKA